MSKFFPHKFIILLCAFFAFIVISFVSATPDTTVAVADDETFTLYIGELAVSNKDSQFVTGYFKVSNAKKPYVSTAPYRITDSSKLYFYIAEENYTYTDYKISFKLRINGSDISTFSIIIKDSEKNVIHNLYEFPSEGIFSMSIVNIHTPANHGREQYNYYDVSGSVIKDFTAPIIEGVASSYANSQRVNYTIKENHLYSVLIDDTALPFGSAGSILTSNYKEGEHTITAIDRAGNMSSCTFKIDKTTPSLDIKAFDGLPVASGSSLNQVLSFSSNEKVTLSFYRLSGDTYYLQSAWESFKIAGFYYDSRELDFTAKKYSHNIFYSASEYETYMLNKELVNLSTRSNFTGLPANHEYANETEMNASQSGKTYYVYASTVSETTTYAVFFDLQRAKNYIKNVVANLRNYSSLNYFWEEGSWKVCATDAVGYSIEKYFVLDFTNPTLSNTASTTYNNQLYSNEAITISASDNSAIANISYRKDGGAWDITTDSYVTIKDSLNNNGKWEFMATDKAGNVSDILSIVLDTVAITLSVNTPAGNSSNYFRDNQNVLLSCSSSDIQLLSLDEDEINITGSSYTLSGATLAALSEGSHLFSATDYAGHITTLTFYIDRTPPELSCDTTYINKTGYLKISIKEPYLSSLTVASKSEELTTRDIYVESLNDGIYPIKVVDKAGNTTTIYFTVDRVSPVFEINPYYNKNETVTINYDNDDYSHATIDDFYIYSPIKSFLASGLADGPHTVIVFDKSGNSSGSQIFIIDSVPPVLSSSNQIKSGDYVNESFTITSNDVNSYKIYWYYSQKSLVECTIYNATMSTDDNINSISFDYSFSNGWYSFLAVDKAKNPSLLFNIYLDFTPPMFNMSRMSDRSAVLDGDYTTSYVSFSITEDTDSYFVFSKKVSGEYIHIPEWDSFKAQYIYFDERYYNISSNPSHTIFYNREDAINAIIETEKKTIGYRGAWHSSDGYIILDSESPYAVQGSLFYTYAYKAIDNEITNYIFFDFDRLISFITNTIVYDFLGYQATNYFWENGDWEVIVYDSAGNIAVKHFVLDTEVPIITIVTPVLALNQTMYGIDDTLTISVKDSNFSKLLLNDQLFESPYTISALTLGNGRHNLKAFDKAGNFSEYSFDVDVTAPVLTMNNIQFLDGKYYYKNQDLLSLIINDVYVSCVYLDNSKISSWCDITVNSQTFLAGTHIFTVYDGALNSSYVYFVVDYTAPVISLSKTIFNALDTIDIIIGEINMDSLFIDDINKGSSRSFLTTELKDGSHTIKVVDRSGNATEIAITTDKTPPSFTLADTYPMGSTIPLNIIEATEYKIVLLSDKSTYSIKDDILYFSSPSAAYGTHTVMVTDRAGNITEKSFFYGTSAPDIFFLKNNIKHYSDIYLSASDELILFVGSSFYSEAFLGQTTLNITQVANEDGFYSYEFDVKSLPDAKYAVRVTNSSEQYSILNFIVDTAPPAIEQFSLDLLPVLNGFYASSDRCLSIKVTDDNFSHLTLNGVRENILNLYWSLEITNTSKLTDNTYSYTFFDKAGNSTSFYFIIDKTAPTITFTKNGISIGKGFSANCNDVLEVSYFDMNFSRILINGENLLDLSSINNLQDGNYEIKVFDLAENSSSGAFFIDSVPPEVKLLKNGVSVQSDSWFPSNTSIIFQVDEFSNCTFYFNEGLTTALNYNSSTLYDGKHTFKAVDKAGNISIVTFYLDLQTPVLTLNKALYETEALAYYNVNDTVIITVNENFLDLSEFTYNLDGGEYQPVLASTFKASTMFDGVYNFKLVDPVGSVSSVSFVIDKIAPNVLLIDTSKPDVDFASKPYATKDISLSVTITDTNKLSGYLLDSQSINTTSTIVCAGLSEGAHLITATDKAGNITEYQFFTDWDRPVISWNKTFHITPVYKSTELISISVQDRFFESIELSSNDEIIFTSNLAVTSFYPSSLLELSFDYDVIMLTARDKSGQFENMLFYIVSQLPSLKVYKNEVLAEEGIYFAPNDYMSFEVSSSSLSSTFYLDEQKIAGSFKFEDALTLSNGTHTIKMIDAAGNQLSFSFEYDDVCPVLIVRKNGRPLTEIDYVSISSDSIVITNGDVLTISATDLHLKSFAFLEDPFSEIIVYGSDQAPGLISYEALDIAGNKTFITLLVDKSPPIISLYKGGIIMPDGTHYNDFDAYITINVADYYLLLYNNLPFDGVAEWDVKTRYEGVHKFEAYDAAGNYSVITFVVDRTSPEIIFNKTASSNGVLYYQADEIVEFDVIEANLAYIKVNGTLINNFYFDTNSRLDGTYSIVIADYSGNSITRHIVIDKTAPEVAVRNGYAGTPMTEGLFASSSSTLYVLFNDANKDYWMLDGTRMDSFPQPSNLENGLHTLIGYDKAGNYSVSTFTVDKDAPVFYLFSKTAYNNNFYYNGDDVVNYYYYDVNFTYVLLNGVEVEGVISTSLLTTTTNTLEAYDLANNFTRITFILDNINPTLTLKKNGTDALLENEYYNARDIISIACSDVGSSIESVSLDGVETVLRSWASNTLSDGTHIISVIDVAKNYTSITFHVDNTPPEFNVQGYYNLDSIIDVYVADENLDVFTIDGNSVKSSYIPYDSLEEGTHTLYAKDKAGNTSSIQFIIDFTNPTLVLYKNSQVVESGFFIKASDTFSIFVNDLFLERVLFDGEFTSTRLWKSEALDERVHTIEVYDLAGNCTLAYLTVDMTAPFLDLQEFYIAGETINLTVSDLTTVTVLLDGVEISDAVLTADSLEEGTHNIVLTDQANNNFQSSFLVDLSAPVLNLSGFSPDGSFISSFVTETYGDLTITVSDVSTVKLWLKHDDADFYYYSVSSFILYGFDRNAGYWQFYAEDNAGYTSDVYSVTAYFWPPSVDITGIVTVTDSTLYTNQEVTIVKDPYSRYVYIFNEHSFYPSQDTLIIEAIESNEGKHSIYVVDAFNRPSELYVIILSFTHNFKNIDLIEESFKQSTWYTVDLPYNIFAVTSKPNIAGSYSFPNWEEALAFAKAQEKEYRVVMVGDVITYVSTSNETVILKYDSYEALDLAVEYYAKKYISSRKTFSFSDYQNTYDTIYSSLTANSPIKPLFIDSKTPLYLVRKEYVPVSNSALSPVSATLTFIASSVGLVTPVQFAIKYGVSLESLLNENGHLYEGYYLYSERDLCGNEESAVLFIDFAEPTISASILRDDGNSVQVITKDLIGVMSGVFYVNEFSVVELFDNMDSDFIGISITSTSFYGLYTKGDTLPVLNSTLGSGLYTVTIFDRSYNTLRFNVIVAGKIPSWLYSSLSASENKLTVYIYKNDQYNAFTSLKLAKIFSDGSIEYLETDSEGRAIDIYNTYYEITSGGKYTFIITDIYGRTTEFEPIFFEKDMPSGLLSGVSNKGVSGKTVTFSYADEFNLTIYTVVPSGAKIPTSEIFPVYDSPINTYIATFNPQSGKTIKYLLVLASKTDPGIYLEYSFELDAEPPLYRILTGQTEISAGSSINTPFKIEWAEVSVLGYVSKDSGVTNSYINGTLITANGLHSFTVKDKVGNESTFEIYLDSEVSFDFNKQVVKLADGSFITNQSIMIKVLEDSKNYYCLLNGVSLPQGSVLEEHGTYSVIIEDLFGNMIDFTLIIDLVTPKFTISNIENGLTNEDINITTDDNTAIISETSFNYETSLQYITHGSTYSAEGLYYFKAVDPAGNIATISITIDKSVSMTASVENNLLTTSAVKLSYDEPVKATALLNGEAIQMNDRFEAVGRYIVTATDLAKNVSVLDFTILPTRVKELSLVIPEQFEIKSVTLGLVSCPVTSNKINFIDSGTYYITLKSLSSGKEYQLVQTVDCTPPEVKITEKNGVVSLSNLSKSNVTAELYKDGTLIEDFLIPGAIEESGSYKIILTDELGNVRVYEFAVIKQLNPFTIVLICVGGVLLALAVFFIIRGRFVKAS
ncbi:MAG: hypothetical protein LBF68_08010 [Christensenellaceae bacterium]|jgi:hypothetical protein|nr:hypothetical protein [Christensenellaceae bacterium]